MHFAQRTSSGGDPFRSDESFVAGLSNPNRRTWPRTSIFNLSRSNMGRARSAGPSRRSVDLTGIISLAEKEDLIILVARITENMTRQIGEVFDCSTPTPSDPGCSNANTWIDISIPLEKLKLKDDCENPATDKEQTVLPAETSRSGTGSTFCSTQNISNIAHKTPPCQLSELKKELLVIFRKWQSIVLQRVRDIRVTETMPQDHFDDQSFVRGRGRGIRGGRGAARGFQGRSSIAARSTGRYHHRGLLSSLCVNHLANTGGCLQGHFDHSHSMRRTRSWPNVSAPVLLRYGSCLL